MDALKHDLRTAFRVLMNRPGFTAIAVLTLALGIGANTTVFSVIDAVLFKSIPFPDPDRLVAIWETIPARNEREADLSFPNFRDYAEGTGAFEGMAAFFARPNQDVNLTGGAVPERVNVARVTSTYFEVLGVEPTLGRAFTDEEDHVGNHRVAILSHGLWTRQFGADPSLVGRAVQVNGFPYVVIGIMPSDFRPVGSMALGEAVDLWRPLAASDSQRDARWRRDLRVIGRLRPGVGRESAQEELVAVADRILQEEPDTQVGRGVRLVTLHEQSVGSVRRSLFLVWGAVGVVLLIACANVANLLLVQASGRAREMSIRASLGASKGRIMHQLLVESVMLATAGAVVGALFAWVGVDVVKAFAGDYTPLLDRASVDTRVLLFTLVAGAGTGVIFGLVPAVHASAQDLTVALKEAGGGSSRSGWTATRGFIITQIALTMVLLVGSGLLIRSFNTLRAVDPGFRTDGLLTLQMELPMVTKYPEQAQRTVFFEELRERLTQLPGVVIAANANTLPMGDRSSSTTFWMEGRAEPGSQDRPVADVRFVSPEYFDALDIPIVHGRSLETSDGPETPVVILVNETLVDRFFGTENPVGVQLDVDGIRPARIVGVVGDVRAGGLAAEPRPAIYYVADQITYNFMTVVVRTQASPRQMLPAVRAEIAAMDSEIPLHNVQTVDEMLASDIGREAFLARLLTGFALMALLLAAVGTYGVMASAVDRRRRELGIRMALGARPVDGFSLVTREGGVLVVIGIAVGLVAALILSRATESVLYEINALDPWAYASTAVVLGTVALATVMATAIRAARTDPAETLKQG